MEEDEEPEHCTMSTPSSTDSWPLWGGVRTTRVRLHENANKRVGGADSSPSVGAVESDTNKSAMALMGFGRLGR